MNFKPNNTAELVTRYLKSARERLESADVLLSIGNHEDAISRAYYAILDAASAFLITKDVIPKSHSGAIKLFSLHFIKTGEVDQKYQKQFARIEKARIEADYTHLRTFERDEASAICKEAEEFVHMAEGKLFKR